MFIRLPAEPSALRSNMKSPAVLHCGGYSEEPILPSIRVLIVEDELFVALDIEQMAEDLGCHAIGIARNAHQAVELAIKYKPEVVLMDVNLGPGKSGTDAAREILAQISCRIVFITAYADPANLALMGEVSAAPVLNKPVALAQLRGALGLD